MLRLVVLVVLVFDAYGCLVYGLLCFLNCFSDAGWVWVVVCVLLVSGFVLYLLYCVCIVPLDFAGVGVWWFGCLHVVVLVFACLDWWLCFGCFGCLVLLVLVCYDLVWL